MPSSASFVARTSAPPVCLSIQPSIRSQQSEITDGSESEELPKNTPGQPTSRSPTRPYAWRSKWD